MNQQQKHMNTKVWKNIVKQAFDPKLNPTGKTVPKSRLYKNTDPQTIINKYAGKGIFDTRKNQKSVNEFITLPNPVGVTYDKKTGKYVPTRKVQIKYTKDGTHVFPVLEK